LRATICFDATSVIDNHLLIVQDLGLTVHAVQGGGLLEAELINCHGQATSVIAGIDEEELDNKRSAWQADTEPLAYVGHDRPSLNGRVQIGHVTVVVRVVQLG